MKLILKNLKQVEYELIIDSDNITVKDLKIQVEKLYSFDSEQIKLIFNGIILDNANILSFYKITENSIIIMMNTKIKKIENTNKTNFNSTYSNKNKIQPEMGSKSNISKILNDNLTIQVNSLVDMGFEKSQVEAAVKAANGRIDLAVEYLNNGIPDNVNTNKNNSRHNKEKNESDITKELKKTAGVIKVMCKDNKYKIFEILNNIKKNDPGLLRLITDYQNEFKIYLDTPITEEEIQNYKNIEERADQINKERREKKERKKKEEQEKKEKMEQNNKKEKKDEGQETKNDNNEEKDKIINDDLEKEKNENKNEEKEDIKEENKERKTEDKKENGDNNKDKIEEMKKNENIENEINKEIKGDEKENDEKKENNDNNNNNIPEENKEKQNNQIENKNNSLINQLTEEEKLIVNRIQSLGNFPQEKVIEAFIVCNKNEELTANYLFEQYM